MGYRPGYYCDASGDYKDEDLWQLAQEIPSVEADAQDILNRLPDQDRELVETMVDDARRINACDMGFPIILTPTGHLADGYHRLTKALLKGERLHFVRLQQMPKPRNRL